MSNEKTSITMQELQQVLNIFEDMVYCMESIISQDGKKSMRRVCLEHRIDYMQFRRIINLKSFGKVYIDKVIDFEDIDIGENPYEKLCRDIFEIPENAAVRFPVDLRETINSVMQRELTELESEVIKLVYGMDSRPMNYTEAGQELGLTRTRIQQLCSRAVWKISKYDNRNEIRLGSVKYNIIKRKTDLEAAQYIKNACRMVEKYHGDLKATITDMSKEEIFTYIKIEALNISLESLNLSVRTYNALKRHNKNTMFDILIMSNDEFVDFRNYGNVSMNEVDTKINNFLSEYGVTRVEFLNYIGKDIGFFY